MEKSVERSCNSKVLRRVAKLLAPLGFRRAKSTFFIRQKKLIIEFIHIHKYSFTAGYRVHLGIRVMNDVFGAPALNGPDSHSFTCSESPNGSQYILHFEADQSSIERCSEEIHRWCSEVGEPWFNQFHDPATLLTDIASPLRENEKARLQVAIKGHSDPEALRVSASLFGPTGDS